MKKHIDLYQGRVAHVGCEVSNRDFFANGSNELIAEHRFHIVPLVRGASWGDGEQYKKKRQMHPNGTKNTPQRMCVSWYRRPFGHFQVHASPAKGLFLFPEFDHMRMLKSSADGKTKHKDCRSACL